MVDGIPLSRADPLSGLEKFIWEDLDQENNMLAITLEREDKAVLDRYEIPLQQPYDASLFTSEQAVPRDPNTTEYLDFEIDNELEGFTAGDTAVLDTWTMPSVSGQRSLAIKVNQTGPQTLFWKTTPKNPALLVGHIYWPDYGKISMEWAIVCETVSGQCVDVPYRKGKWTTFHMSLRQLTVDGEPIDRSKTNSIFLRVNITGEGISADNPALILLDDLVTYYDPVE